MSDLSADLAFSLGGETSKKNLTDIISIVRFRGDFRNTVRFPDASITPEIQAAWGELYELIADTNEGYWDTDTQIATTTSQSYVELPSDSWRIRGIDRLDGSDYIGLAQVGISDRNRFSSSTDRPCAYRLSARGAELYPTPNAEYTLRLTYTPVVPALGLEQFSFFNDWQEFVVFGALVRLTLNEERDAGAWQQQFEIQRMRITRGASQRKAQEPEYLMLHDSGDDFGRDERWR